MNAGNLGKGAAAMLLASLAACGGPVLNHAVSQPVPAPLQLKRMSVERPAVSSREADEATRALNREWVDYVAAELGTALRDREITIADNAPAVVRAQVYIGYERTVHRTEDGRRSEPGFAEVQIRLTESSSGTVIYSTFTKAKIHVSPFAGWFGWGPDTREQVREIIREAAREFASRL